MTCKDCIHYEACKSMCEAFGFTVDGDGEAASERCERFEKVLENSEFADLVARLRLTDSRSKRALLDSAAYAIEYLQIQMNREHLAHLRLQDFEVAEAEQLHQMRVERSMLSKKLREKESVLSLLRQGKQPWRDAETESPATDDFVLAIVNGKPEPNITLVDAFQLASYCPEDGWFVEEYPKWETPIVAHWMPLPEPPEEVNYDL